MYWWFRADGANAASQDELAGGCHSEVPWHTRLATESAALPLLKAVWRGGHLAHAEDTAGTPVLCTEKHGGLTAASCPSEPWEPTGAPGPTPGQPWPWLVSEESPAAGNLSVCTYISASQRSVATQYAKLLVGCVCPHLGSPGSSLTPFHPASSNTHPGRCQRMTQVLGSLSLTWEIQIKCLWHGLVLTIGE